MMRVSPLADPPWLWVVSTLGVLLICTACAMVGCQTSRKDLNNYDTADTADTADASDSDDEPDTSDTSTETAEQRCIGSGPWVSVSAGYNGSCGIHPDGCIECWTATDTGAWTSRIDETGWYGQTGNLVPPDGEYSSVDLGRCAGWGTHTCAIRQLDGGIDCWGSDAWRAASAPPGVWMAVSLGEDDGCALGTSGRIGCWGRYIGAGDSASYSLAADYVAVSNCDWIVCGLASDGRADCWQVGLPDDVWSYPGPWTAVTTDWHPEIFGVTPEGELSATLGSSFLPDPPSPAGDLCVTGLDEGGCVLDIDGNVYCSQTLQPVPDGTFTSLTCGGIPVCGTTVDGQILCWGDCRYGRCDVPVHE